MRSMGDQWGAKVEAHRHRQSGSLAGRTQGESVAWPLPPPTPASCQHLPLTDPNQEPQGKEVRWYIHKASLLGHQTGTGRAENGIGRGQRKNTRPWGPPSGEFIITCSLSIHHILELINRPRRNIVCAFNLDDAIIQQDSKGR